MEIWTTTGRSAQAGQEDCRQSELTGARTGARGRGYVYMEAGRAGQSLMLRAVALGLGATMVEAFDDEAVARLLRLEADETPRRLLPVGTP